MNDQSKTASALEQYSEKPLGNIKVLMIEDDTFLSELILSKLSSEGCVPYGTGDGAEGVQLAAQYQPDVIILDLMLPGMSGEEVLEKLKSDPTLKAIPVIVFSNKSLESEIQHVLDLGAERFLMKSSTDINNLADVVLQMTTGAK